MTVSEMTVSIIKNKRMKFYNREKELARLNEIKQRSASNAQLTVVTGRRRIGKTQLLLRINNDEPVVYFFVARKAESFLCQDFQQEIVEKLKIPVMGEITNFGKLFEYLMLLSEHRPFTLIIDEFQEFFRVAPGVYSEIQHYWDIHKDKSKINMIVSGSVYSLMHRIFESEKEPLFGRATALMNVKSFEITALKEILADHNPDYTPEDLLALYSFTGGVAKYVQQLMDGHATTYRQMLNYLIQEDSLFLNEGKNMLIEEFGTEYAVYFTILSAIARGENTRAKIEATVNREIGGYLTKLDRDYGLITKNLPIFSKVETKNVIYSFEDNFLTFWFRFIYKYSYMLEVGNYDGLRNIIDRDYKTFSGKMLEKYFRTKIIQTQPVTQIGSYWDRKGENEIDLVVVNELNKQAQIIEVKRNPDKINLDALKVKGIHFLHATGMLKDYQITYSGLSIEDC
jgi:AAA+ ATPase superfamily predicted ATPase